VNANTSLHLHPLLSDVFELLHRMTKSQDEALAWLAWEAIGKLQNYEEQARSSCGPH